MWYKAPSLRVTYPSPRLWVLTWASVPDTAFSQGSRWAESLWGVRLPSCWQVQKAGAWFQASHSTRGLCSHLIPQSTLVGVSLCHMHTPLCLTWSSVSQLCGGTFWYVCPCPFGAWMVPGTQPATS